MHSIYEMRERFITLLLILCLIGCGDLPERQHAVYLDRVVEDISVAEQWKCGLVELPHETYDMDGRQYITVTVPPDTVSWWMEQPERMGVTLLIDKNHLLAVGAEWLSDNMLELAMPYGHCYVWDRYYSCPDIQDRGQVPQIFHCISIP